MSKSDQVDRTNSTNKPTDAQLDPAKQQVEPSPAPKVESASSLTNPGPDRKNALKHGAYSGRSFSLGKARKNSTQCCKPPGGSQSRRRNAENHAWNRSPNFNG